MTWCGCGLCVCVCDARRLLHGLLCERVEQAKRLHEFDLQLHLSLPRLCMSMMMIAITMIMCFYY